MDRLKLNRRQFLKLAGATGLLAVPTLSGYGLWRDVQGELPASVSPYDLPEKAEQRLLSPVTGNSPILVVINELTNNPFGLYLAEILRAEGLNCFQIAELSTLNNDVLAQFDITLLAEGMLDQTQVELLENYVGRGGRLVAMRPDPHLSALFGLELVSGNTAEGYLQPESDQPIGQGIATETIQFHGVADHYRLAGAQVIAWLASDANTRTNFPAVTYHRYGRGQTALWAFDLARSVAYTRQGNPAWANQERDDFWKVRTVDMFKDWVDLDRLPIPQADEQQRLLANLLLALSQESRPLPRLWYFPGTAKGMLIATTDAHQNSASAVEAVLARVEPYHAHISIYYLPPLYPDWRRMAQKARWWAADLSLRREAYLPSPQHIADWRARGHEFTLHPLIVEGVEASWQLYWKGFTGLDFGPISSTTRTHTIAWNGWVETARVQASYGIRMNLDYYHVGPAFRKANGEWAYGHFTGSGLPMKFVDEQGRILNIYQQLTQLADDHLLNLHWGSQAGLSAPEAIEVSQKLLRSSLDGYYSAVTAIFHTDPFDEGENWAAEETRWLEGTLDYAASQGIPIWSAAEWLRFTETRHDTHLTDVDWQPATRRLSFRLAAPATPEVELTVMIPLHHGEVNLDRIEVDGIAVTHSEHTVRGVGYGGVSMTADSHHVSVIYL